MANFLFPNKDNGSLSHLGSASLCVAVFSVVLLFIGKMTGFSEFFPIFTYQLIHPELYQSLYLIGIGLGLAAALEKGKNPRLPAAGLLANGLLGFVLPFRVPILGGFWANLIICLGVILISARSSLWTTKNQNQF